jgi:UMP-CMP kinase
MSKDWKVIFVLGGPGAGKSNQCKNLSTDYQLCHLSIGDILLAELKKPDSKYAPIIYKNMTEGTIGPPHITVSLLETAMEEAAEKKRVSVFFIDGGSRISDLPAA